MTMSKGKVEMIRREWTYAQACNDIASSGALLGQLYGQNTHNYVDVERNGSSGYEVAP